MNHSDRTPPALPTEDDPRWALIQARDRTADGLLWYSVVTTGVYCRPSCASRVASPGNVVLHDTLEAARRTGCRPCLRCDPDGVGPRAAQAALVARACATIAASDATPLLDLLAAEAGLSPAYFHRMFRRLVGLTPRAYAAAVKAARVREGLAAGRSVTETIYDAGFSSSGRFYEAAGGMLGMAPSRYRDGGAAETLHFALGDCSLGAILVASSAAGIAAVLLGPDADALRRELRHRFAKATLIAGDRDYGRLVARVVAMVEAPALGLDLPLDLRGTAFQHRVWKALREIPPGTTVSYTELAAAVGAPRAARAVASACAANPVAVAVPCHRVVRRDGGVAGYRWGVDRKRSLLARERARS